VFIFSVASADIWCRKEAMKHALLSLLTLSLCLPLMAREKPKPATVDYSANWHQWRGPLGNGMAPEGNPPVRWSETNNLKWKVAIPGSGSATPIVWGNQIFVVSAIKTDRKPKVIAGQDQPGGRFGGFRMSTPTPTTVYQFVILCLDRTTGKTLWQKVAVEEKPHAGHHPSHGYASASPITDGKNLYVSFGSRGVFCYDLKGNFKWKRNFGDMRIKVGFGEGTSPALHGDSLVVNWDHEGDSFITSLNAKTGKEIWRKARSESTTWATPFIVEHDGKMQVITNGRTHTRSYDLATGELLWQCGGMTGNPIPTPVTRNGTAYLMTGFRGYALYAIPLSARGDLTGTDKIIWHRNQDTPYVASPLLYDSLLYFTKERTGMIACAEVATGKIHFSGERLAGIRTIYASLVGAAGKVYVTGRGGTIVVLKHGLKYEVLATNKLNEGIDASPVIVGKELILRGQKHLYSIAKHNNHKP
jgi:outer membrane protein assembly factor BamB